MSNKKNILIVGAGAVGQVYGFHLHQAGHRISFLVKPSHVEALRNGMTLHQLGFFSTKTQHWADFHLIADPLDASPQPWDQIWLTVPSTALRTESIEHVLAASGDATVIGLQPDASDADWLAAHLPSPENRVQGMIGFISYQSPLPGTPGLEGMCYFLPPVSASLFEGDNQNRRDAVIRDLKAGGMATQAIGSIDESAHGADGMLIPLVAALELHGWRLQGFAQSPEGKLGQSAASEALKALQAARGTQIRWQKRLNTPRLLQLGLLAAPRVLPLPLEPYLKFHFSKVGAQTRQMLASYREMAIEHGLSVTALEELMGRLGI